MPWGYLHAAARNAEAVMGRMGCASGCPTEAKRSTNVVYPPCIAGRGGALYRDGVERLPCVVGAVGVLADCTDSGAARKLVIRADHGGVGWSDGQSIVVADNGFRLLVGSKSVDPS